MVQTVALADGGFITAWSAGESGVEAAHYLQQYDADGQPVGEPVAAHGHGLVVASSGGAFLYVGGVEEELHLVS